MNVTKKLLMSLLLIAGLGLLKVNEVGAVITQSPHDVIGWFAASDTLGGTAGTKAGICAYCHIPHSSKGDRLFPDAQVTEKATYGMVAALCAKCHQSNTYLNRNDAVVNKEIFYAMDTANWGAITGSDSTMDTHPIKHTNNTEQTRTLQNTNLTEAINRDWGWTTTWVGYADGKDANTNDIECTSCHNPHTWNQNAFNSTSAGLSARKFLRAPFYDTAGPTGFKNFCSYCHPGREISASSNALGMHPVADANSSTNARFSDWGLASDSGGLYKDYNYMIRGLSDSSSLNGGTDRGKKAIFDTNTVAGAYLGARLYNNDVVICQSCHMPHGAMHTEDDVYTDTGAMNQLRVGPLLAVNNATSFSDYTPSSGNNAPSKDQYPAAGETPYVLGSGHEENLLCEWCHGMSPDLTDTLSDTSSFAHPVNLFPTPTNDNIPSDTSDYESMDIRYPLASWRKYRESGGIRGVGGNPTYTAGDSRAPSGPGSWYLVCLSCHEAHQAQPNTPLLKFGADSSYFNTTGADTTFCDGCHNDLAMGSGSDYQYFSDWTTHPSGRTARLVTSDVRTASGGTSPTLSATDPKLPNRARLQTFRTGTDEYISCWTCHKAHKGVEKPLLADYQSPFSQLCVNCHCEGDTVTVAASATALWKYGTNSNTLNGNTNGNPSYYYKEGAAAVNQPWWNYTSKLTLDSSGAYIASTEYATADVTRLGSHFIGQFTGTRLDTSVAGGWLGERTSNRQLNNTTIKLNTIVHTRGTGAGDATGDRADKWLDSANFVDQVWATTATNPISSNQKSHVGVSGGNLYVICQSCHAVHNTAKGIADNPGISRLLLASNEDSYMCKRCHIPEIHDGTETTKTHPMHFDTIGMVMDTVYYAYNTVVTRVSDSALVNVDSSKYAYVYNSTLLSANYARHRLNCDGCHSVHNADSKMGAMILEGDSSTTGKTIPAPLWNKVPTMEERDDKKTCDLCHFQGKK